MDTKTTVKSNENDDESFFERWLIAPKVLYFILNLFVYTFHGIVPIIFIENWKFTYYQYGYASSVAAIGFFGAMFWTSLAQRTGKFKHILVTASIGYTICCLLTLLNYFHSEETNITKMLLAFLILGMLNFFLSACFPLLDAQIIGILVANPKVHRDQFGNQRMFGAIGHFTATLLSFISKSNLFRLILQSSISTIFVIIVIFTVQNVEPVLKSKGSAWSKSKVAPVVDKLESVGIPGTPDPASALEELEHVEAGVEKHPIIRLLTNGNFMFFMLFIASAGIVRSVLSSFQKPFAKAVNGKDNPLIKVAYLDIAKLFSEIAMYLSAKHIRKSLGIYWVLIISQVFGILRLLGYGIFDAHAVYTYYAIMGLELMKGLNSGLFSSSAIPIASEIAPKGCEAPAQGLFSGNYASLSMAAGGIIGGAYLQMVYDPTKEIENAQGLFRIVSIANAIIMLILMMKYIFIDRIMGIPGFPRRQSVNNH